MHYKSISYDRFVVFDPIFDDKANNELSSRVIYVKKHDVLIDFGGISYTELLLAEIEKNRIRLDNTKVLLSHLHEDHIGNLGLLSDYLGKRIIVYTSQREILRFLSVGKDALKENRQTKADKEKGLEHAVDSLINDYDKKYSFENIYSLDFVEKKQLYDLYDVVGDSSGKIFAFEAESHTKGNIVFFYREKCNNNYDNVAFLYLADFFGVKSENVDREKRRQNIRKLAKLINNLNMVSFDSLDNLGKFNKQGGITENIAQHNNRIIRISGHNING